MRTANFLFCSVMVLMKCYSFLCLDSLDAIGVQQKAGFAQTTNQQAEVDHVQGPHAPPYLIGGLRSFLFSSEILPLLSMNDSGAFLSLLEDISLPTFHIPSPLHTIILAFCIPARLLPAFYLSHHIVLSCRESSIWRKFTQMRVYGL